MSLHRGAGATQFRGSGLAGSRKSADTLTAVRASHEFSYALTSFFVLIVVVPMVAIAFLVFRLIGDSETGKAQARANGLATAAASLYTSQSAAARVDARTIGRSGLLLSRTDLRSRLGKSYTQKLWMRVKRKAAYLPGC